jgi:GDPmannose 4,6-dehydratase
MRDSVRTALVFGVSGQDGSYLARFLLDKGYTVHGTSRDATRPFARHEILGIRGRVILHSVSMLDFDELRRLILAVRPDEIYNLSGLSSVARSFADPAMARRSITDAHLMLLEVLHSLRTPARLYHAASSECFGDTPRGLASDEQTPFAPRSPYAEAKAAAHRATCDFRDRYGLHAVSGILFNHESPLRDEVFVTRKIVAAAAAVAAGRSNGKLAVGDLSVSRDWGYCAESVEAMWLMLQQEQPEDLVIATGESHTVEELACAAFAEFDLDHREHIVVDRSLFRPTDLSFSRGNPARARERLGWEARTKFADLVKLLAGAERARIT